MCELLHHVAFSLEQKGQGTFGVFPGPCNELDLFTTDQLCPQTQPSSSAQPGLLATGDAGPEPNGRRSANS